MIDNSCKIRSFTHLNKCQFRSMLAMNSFEFKSLTVKWLCSKLWGVTIGCLWDLICAIEM